MRKIGQASVLSEKEWAKLDSVCRSSVHRTIWALLRYTGARINEVLLLRLEDVYEDYEKRIVYDAVAYRRENRKGKDKNHCVPVCSHLKLLLRGYVQPVESEWLFPSPTDPTKPISYRAVQRYLRRKANEAGLGNLRVTTHSGRRSCITELARRGTDIKTIQAVSGHQSLANLARYIDTDPDRTKKALEGIF